MSHVQEGGTLLLGNRMSEEIDKHVLRKYEIVSKLGKGVLSQRARHPCSFQKLQSALNEVLLAAASFVAFLVRRLIAGGGTGVWDCMEGDRQEDARGGGAQEGASPIARPHTPLLFVCKAGVLRAQRLHTGLRCVPECDRCAANVPRDHVSAGTEQP